MQKLDELHDIIRQEIALLRDYLSSLTQARVAVVNKNKTQLDGALSLRLDILDSYFVLELKVVALTTELSNNTSLITQSEALEVLEKTIPYENIDLHTSLGQLKAVLGEIQSMRQHTFHVMQEEKYKPLRRESQVAKKSHQKIGLGLMEPEETFVE